MRLDYLEIGVKEDGGNRRKCQLQRSEDGSHHFHPCHHGGNDYVNQINYVNQIDYLNQFDYFNQIGYFN